MGRARKEGTIMGEKRCGGSQGARYGTIKTRKPARYKKKKASFLMVGRGIGTLCWWPFTSGLQLAFNLNLINMRNVAHQPDPLNSCA